MDAKITVSRLRQSRPLSHQLALRVDRAMIERVAAVANDLDLTSSEVTRRAITLGLEIMASEGGTR